MKKTVLFATAAGLMMGASAATADVTAYGRVLYNIISDDTSDDLYFGRHEFAESNIGIKGSKKVGDLTVGAQVEIGLNEGVATLLQNGSNSRNRIQELTLAGSFGKVGVGTGPSATWVISDVDQSGTWVNDPLGMSQRFGATRRGPGGQSQTPFVQTQSIFSERLRYDSPKFLGGAAQIVAQLGEDGSNEIGFKYLKNGLRITAWSTSYGDGDNDEDPQANIDTNEGTPGFFGAEDGAGFLVAYKHSSGLNINVARGESDLFNGSDREFTNVKLGYTAGKNAFSVSRGDYQGSSLADHERTTLAYTASLTGGVKLWAQATKGETVGEESFNAIALGGMVKF